MIEFENWFIYLANGALFTMMLCVLVAFYRVAKPRQAPADRLVGVEMITNLLVGIVVLLAVIERTDTTIDIGIGIAALSLAGTVSIARFIAEGRVV